MRLTQPKTRQLKNAAGPPYRPPDPSIPSIEERRDFIEQSCDELIKVYEDREIYAQKMYESYEDYRIIDLDPQPNDPDPNYYPVQEFDPGAPAPVSELEYILRGHPHYIVSFGTPEYMSQVEPTPSEADYKAQAEHFRKTQLQRLQKEKLRQGYPASHVMKLAEEEYERHLKEVQQRSERTVELTEDNKECLRRFAQIWNFNTVNGEHLILNGPPKWADLFGDLDQSQLKQFYLDEDFDYSVHKQFNDHNWYHQQPDIHMSPQYVGGKEIWWAPTLSLKTLVNELDDVPTLRGDQFELLRHRFAVGCTIAKYISLASVNSYWIDTYADLDWLDSPVNVDMVAQIEDGFSLSVVGEVLTQHHDIENWRETAKKLRAFDQLNSKVVPVLVAPNRTTIIEILNQLQKDGLISYPGKEMQSGWKLEDVQSKKIRRARESPNHQMPIQLVDTANGALKYALRDPSLNESDLREEFNRNNW